MDALPQDNGAPVFRAPWEAKVFALQLGLFESGAFTWREWTERLGAEIAKGDAADDEEGTAHYRYWLRALEGLMAEKGIAAPGTLAGLAEDWLAAAARTPHGRPILLDRDLPA
ncbi:MAG: nitrile hydratase accessory protein [Rhodobiaceae bacterium]|nr:nitrile hydratase accessory protein [Rhodobiaceae bacterium]